MYNGRMDISEIELLLHMCNTFFDVYIYILIRFTIFVKEIRLIRLIKMKNILFHLMFDVKQIGKTQAYKTKLNIIAFIWYVF